MKTKKWLALSMACVAMAACSADEGFDNSPSGDDNGKTALVSLKLDIAGPYTKGNPADGSDLAGTEAERKLNHLKVVLCYPSSIQKTIDVDLSSATSETEPGWDATGHKLTFEAPVGAATLYVYANVVDADKANLPASTDASPKPDFQTAVSSGSAAGYYSTTTGSESFFMSNKDGVGVTATIEENKTNEVKVEVERAAVKISAECATTVISGQSNGTIKDASLQFKTFNVANKFRLLADNDMTALTDLGHEEGSTVSIETGKTAFDNGAADNDKACALSHTYCLENLILGTNNSTATYVNFTCLYTPNAVLDLEQSGGSGTTATWKPKGSLKNNSVAEGAEYPTFYVVKGGIYNDSYLLAADIENKTEGGITLASQEDAGHTYTVTGIDGISTVVKYEKGQCWFGPVFLSTTGNTASKIYRNDWYNLQVTKITPPGAANPPGTDAETTNIELEVSVLPWNFFSKEIELK